MKANVGMQYPVASPITAYTPGTGVTYGTGFVVSQARGASITWEREDGEFRGDDARIDSMNGVLGYSLDFEAAGISDDVRNKLLGEVVANTSEYTITDASAPDVGFGYIKVMRDDASGTVVENYEAWWYWKMKFGLNSEETRTKERTIEWRVPTLNGVGDGVQLTSDKTLSYATHKTFATFADAKTWLKTKAGIT